MKNFYKLLLVLLIPVNLFAQDTSAVKREARVYVNAMLKGDYDKLIYRAYPGYVQMMGGKAALMSATNTTAAQMKAQGISLESMTLGRVGHFYNAGKQIHCLIPEKIVMLTSNGRLWSQSQLLCISDDHGKSWTFMGADNSTISKIPTLFPLFNHNLVIPDQTAWVQLPAAAQAATAQAAPPPAAAAPPPMHMAQPSANDLAADEALLGGWKIISTSPAVVPNQLFQNNLLELHSTMIGISRNAHLNSEKNVKLFIWTMLNDTLHLLKVDPYHASTTETDCLVTFVNDNLIITGLSAPAKVNSGQKPFRIVLTRQSANPLDAYTTLAWPNGLKGEWISLMQKKESNWYNELSCFDIYPSNDYYGEIVQYPNARHSKIVHYDSLNFIKYSYENKVALQMLHQINPGGNGVLQTLLKMGGKETDPTDTTYFFKWMNSDSQEKVHFYRSDGILVIDEGSNGIDYLLQRSTVNRLGGAALHDAYNAHFGKNILPKFGMHFQSCPHCHGTGRYSDPTDYYTVDLNKTDENGQEMYENRVNSIVCPACNGTGGGYVDDSQMMPVSAPPMPAWLLANLGPQTPAATPAKAASQTPDAQTLDFLEAKGSKSGKSTDKADLSIFNNSAGSVKLYWVDFDGNEKLYATLPAHTQVVQPSYISHVWMFQRENAEPLYVRVNKTPYSVDLK